MPVDASQFSTEDSSTLPSSPAFQAKFYGAFDLPVCLRRFHASRLLLSVGPRPGRAAFNFRCAYRRGVLLNTDNVGLFRASTERFAVSLDVPVFRPLHRCMRFDARDGSLDSLARQ